MDDNRVLLLEQDFHNYKELMGKELNLLNETTKEQEKRIIELERNNTKTDLQYEQIMKTLNKLNEVTIPSLTAQIEDLKNRPNKRYDQIITVIISTIIGGAIGFVINKFFGG